MPRSTAGLFVPLFEAVVLSAICYPSLHAFFSTVPLDYSPAMRHSLFCSLVLSLLTAALQLILSAAERSDYVGQQKLVGPRQAMDVANAYCSSAGLLFFVFVALFMQATSFSGQLDASISIRRSNMVVSSQQAEWVYAVAGASGGWVISPDKVSRIPLQPVTVPFMGSIYGGMVMGYVGMVFLLSIYISYMATPDSASSYLFMEPRFLVIASGFLGFGTGQAVSNVYGGCADPAGHAVGFSCFVVVAAFFDLLLMFMGDKVYMYGKWIGLQVMAIVPLIFFLSGDVPATIKACCGILVAAATASNGIDLVFHGWNPADAASSADSNLESAGVDTTATPLAELGWRLPALDVSTGVGSGGVQAMKALDYYPRKRN